MNNVDNPKSLKKLLLFRNIMVVIFSFDVNLAQSFCFIKLLKQFLNLACALASVRIKN